MHELDKIMREPKLPKTIEEAFKAFLIGTTCYDKELFWKDNKGRFFILKHNSHSEYLNRFDGSKSCPVYYILCDIEDKRNTVGNYAYGDSSVKCLKVFTGRWKKSNFDVVQQAIQAWNKRSEI